MFEVDFPLNGPQRMLLASLERVYTAEMVALIVSPTLVHESVSLRLLDWLVTNYSKKNRSVCVDGDGRVRNIHFEYRSALHAYRRRNFDPFRRRQRIRAHGVETTIGQLNFLQWAHKCGVLAFASENIATIEADMSAVCAASKKRRADPNSRRCELSTPSHLKCAIYEAGHVSIS